MVGYPSLESKWGFALWLPTNFGNDLSHIADRPLDTFIGEGGGGAVEENENNEGSRLQMDIKLLLDETILPEVDNFLKQALPLSIDFKPEQGDTLTIIRNRFPEQSAELMSQEQLSALREYRVKILEAFKSGDYVSGLELTEEGLKVAAKRDDKIFLLKMKGSLHFLLEEKKRALETWKHVLRLNPEDEEVAQMISSLD